MPTPKHILCGCVLNRCTDLQTPKTYLARLCTENRCTDLRNQGNFRKVCAVVYWTVHVYNQTYLVGLCTEPSMPTPKHILCGCILNRPCLHPNISCAVVYWIGVLTSGLPQGLARFSWLKYAWVTFSRLVRLCTEPSMSTPKHNLVRLCTENRCTDFRTTPRDQGLPRFSWLKYAWVTFLRFVRLCT